MGIKKTWKRLVFILCLSLLGSNVAMAQEMSMLPEGTIITEYGKRTVTRTDVGDDIYTLITDVYDLLVEEPYIIYTLITSDDTITYNTNTNVMDLGDREVTVTFNEGRADIGVADIFAENASRPTSIDHGLTFKSNWVYIQSHWIDCEAEEAINDLGKGGLFILLNYLVPGLGDVVEFLDQMSNYFSVYRPMDSACWIRRYEYANQYILSQFQNLATQGYTYDYVQIPGAVTCVKSELAS